MLNKESLCPAQSSLLKGECLGNPLTLSEEFLCGTYVL